MPKATIDETIPREVPAAPWLMTTLLFFSGLCALIYQVGWQRELRLVFGASTFASSAVLAIFMGGLSTGAVVLGLRADRLRRPLLLYGLLELGIAAGAFASPYLFTLVRRAYVSLGGSFLLGDLPALGVRLLLSALAMAVPTFLMGGTFPVAMKTLPVAGSRRRLALMYGINAFGGVCGVLLATFLLLERTGIRRMLVQAVLVNAGIGVAALVAAARLRRVPPGSHPCPDDRARLQGTVSSLPSLLIPPGSPFAKRGPRGEGESCEADLPDQASALRRGILYALTCLLGFTFFLMEIVWYRMLAPLLGGTSYTFGFILATALLGIGAGGLAQHMLDHRLGRSMRLLAATCGLLALGFAVAYGLGDRIAVLAALLRPPDAAGLAGHIGDWLSVCALVVLPASMVAGFQFPLIIGLLGRGGRLLGGHTAVVYAWNTAGAITGALVGGFVLLPSLGALACWRLAVLLAAAACAGALFGSLVEEGRHPLLALPGVFALGAVALLTATGPTAAWRHSPIAVHGVALRGKTANAVRNWINGQRFNIVWEQDGIESSIGLGRSDGFDLIINGKSDGNARTDAGTQIMAAIVPAILHPEPRKGLVIGLGTGTSAGWLAAVDTVAQVDVVEMEAADLEVAHRSAPVNRNALANPRVRVIVGDGREFVMTTQERYDVIMSEPSNPFRAGVASLYTREFYEQVARRLAPGGVFAQWLQAYDVDEGTVRVVRATLASVFPDVQTWRTTLGDLLFTCAREQLVIHVPELRKRLATEPFRSALLAGWGVTGLEGFLGGYLANDSVARRDASRNTLNTDDRMIAEFGFARGIEGDLFVMDDIRAAARASGANRPDVQGGSVDWARVDRNGLLQLAWQNDSAWEPPGGDAVLGAYEAWTEGALDAVARIWASGRWVPTEPLEFVMVAEALAELGDERALPQLVDVRRQWPAAAAAIEARLLLRRNDPAGALRALAGALSGYREGPWCPKPVMRRTLALAEELAAVDVGFAARIFESLSEPFSVRILDARRISSLVMIARGLEPSYGVRALEQVEPDVFWQESFLRFRLETYERAGSALAARARRDLDEFVSAR